MAHLEIHLLGTIHIMLDGKTLTGFATDKARALLAYLALESEHPQRRDALATLLWPDQPESKARQSLRQTLLYLRQALNDDQCATPFLLVDRDTVQLNPASDYHLDVAEFQALRAACQSHTHHRRESCLPCLRRMAKMSGLYRGEFLENFFVSDSTLFEEWATLKREWLHREAIEALFTLTDYYTRRGELARARQAAWRQVELEPWREEAHRQLMRLLALEGQRSAALAQYETCRRILRQELGVEPMTETAALFEAIRCEEIEAQPRDNGLLLPPTRFVGRESELAELAEWLAAPDCRLVTLVGPGGIGKSRLVLQVMEEHRGLFAHGVAFVSLGAVTSAEFIAYAIAGALHFSLQGPQSPDAQVLNYLREKEMLLALDNFEHLLSDCTLFHSGLIEQILKHAPGVRLLVTSRERLNLREEWVYRLDGLTYPKTDPARLDNVESYSAVALFTQSAQRMNRRFTLNAHTYTDVVGICRLVEGVPLGLELAAAWVDTRTCGDIAREIAANSDVLTSTLRNVDPRHRSLRASFEYSWKLLTDAERACLARLAAFQGSFDRQAATQVATASPALLAGLIHKSLLRVDANGRYSLHPLLHQYVAEKLDATGNAATVYTEHARYYAASLERQESYLKGAAQKQALAAITLESDNVRQAWEWAVSQGYAREIERSLESLYHFCDIRCWFQAGVALLTPAIERWNDDPAQEHLLGKLVARLGALYQHQGFYQEAIAALERGLDIFERLEMPDEQIFSLVNLANAIRHQGRNDEAERLAQKSLALSKHSGDRRGMAQSLQMLGILRYWGGDLEQTEALLEESLALARELGDQRLIMAPLNTLGDAACHRGDYDKAQRMFEECLALSRDLDDQFNVSIHLNNLGTVYHYLEAYPQARSFYQESLAICRQIGDQNGQAIALSNLGEIAYTLGDYRKASQFYREGLSIGRAIQEPWTIMTCLNNLGEIACAHSDCREAQTYLTEALQIAQETQTLTMATKILVNLARLFAQQGMKSQAAVLLDLVRRHPASESDIQEKAGHLLDELGLAPPSRTPRGLDEVIKEILK